MGKVRESNFELLRLLSMLMVVLLHTLSHGGAFTQLNVFSMNFVLAHFMESFAIVAVNCFILIAGYFGIQSHFEWKKVGRLYLQVSFYSILISVGFWVFGLERVTTSSLIMTLFPILSKLWWFMTLYLVLYVLSPYLNKLLNGLSHQEYTQLVLLLLGIFVVWPSISYFKPIDLQKGYSLYQFTMLYVLGGYVQRFFQHHHIPKRYTLTVYIASSMSLALYQVFVSRGAGTNTANYAYNFLPIVMASIALFLFFKELKLQSTLVNRFSMLTLGVYLLHDHLYVRAVVYNLFHYDAFFESKWFAVWTLVIVVVIYIVAMAIEALRIKLFDWVWIQINRFFKTSLSASFQKSQEP